jgi:hypothetical protein
MGMMYGTTESSYRKASELINWIRYQAGATPSRSLREQTEAEGMQVREAIERKTAVMLQQHNFTEEGTPQSPAPFDRQASLIFSAEEGQEAQEACGLLGEDQHAMLHNLVCYEDPEHTVNISLDDVIVKQQKEERRLQDNVDEEERKRKDVHNTIAHIQKQEQSYTVNGSSVVLTLRIVLGFLLNNDLLRYRLQFFVDGQKTLHAAIIKAFSWYSNIVMILDWYHLEEKCKKQLSMAMKGRHMRNAILAQLRYDLWYGLVDQAMLYLSTLDDDLIRNRVELENLVNYLARNRPYIPGYAVRKRLGLRHSSNIGEKMNDLVVSERQKHNGMSWSKSGSVSLASLTALKRNKEYKKWFEESNLAFQFSA